MQTNPTRATAPVVPVRIAMIHATDVAMAPIEAAFERLWPEARRVNLIDDALPADLERSGTLTAALTERIARLAGLALDAGAHGILYTCSAFGPAIEAVAARLPIPVLKPNEAMFEAALARGRRLGMIATFAPAIAPMEAEFRALCEARGVAASLHTVHAPGAIEAARSRDIARHDALVAQAAPALHGCDAVMLAQFSTSTAVDAVGAVLACPVFSAPDAAVRALRTRCGGMVPITAGRH